MTKPQKNGKTRLHFVSLGCPKNLVDSEVMIGKLTDAGFVLVAEPKRADAIIINTCAFIEDAKQESVDTIIEMARYKKKDRCRLLVVAGCLPQRYKDELSKLLPEVDIFVGTGEFNRIDEIIKEWAGEKTVCVGRPTYIYDHEEPRILTTPPHIAYLKIAEGCLHPCSFCIVPKIRGKFRSRPPESILTEAKSMLDRGIKEINLIAQDTMSYGVDIDEDLFSLLDGLARLPGEKWIRIMYAHPDTVTDDVIRAIRDIDDICAYIDLPVQHISDKILKRMKRKKKSKEIRTLIDRLRANIPRIAIRTSLIVGFPGETDEDFDDLLDFVSEAKFEHLGVFEYSPEEGTSAAELDKKVPRKIAEERRNIVMDLQREISLGNNRKYIGKKLVTLVSGASSETNILLEGRHEGQAHDIDGVVYINSGIAAAGDFAVVEITDAHEYDLVGKIVG